MTARGKRHCEPVARRVGRRAGAKAPAAEVADLCEMDASSAEYAGGVPSTTSGRPHDVGAQYR